MKKIFLFIAVCLAVMKGCAPPVSDDDEDRQLTIIYTDWAESVALTNMVALLLEERLDYEVVMKLAGADTVFMEIASGDADIFADAWLPLTHEGFMKKYGEELEDLGPNYNYARTGLVVPAYADMEYIGDLKQHPGLPVVGIDGSAGIMENAIAALDGYGLDNELLVLSDEEMSARVGEAIKRRAPVVFTGWEPHWLFYRYELRYLEDPLGVFPGVEQIHTLARKGFREDHPRAATFFERMVLTEKQINELLYEVLSNRDPVEGVRSWKEKNQTVVNRWVRGLRPEREKIM